MNQKAAKETAENPSNCDWSWLVTIGLGKAEDICTREGAAKFSRKFPGNTMIGEIRQR